MQYGICNLSIVPIRKVAAYSTEMVSRLQYGEHFKVLNQRKYWNKIRTVFDNNEGFIDYTKIFNNDTKTYQYQLWIIKQFI